jgi:hypothetical protein
MMAINATTNYGDLGYNGTTEKTAMMVTVMAVVREQYGGDSVLHSLVLLHVTCLLSRWHLSDNAEVTL